MWDSLITVAQLWGIGLVFGLTGPCLFSCAPLVFGFAAQDPGAWTRPGARFLLFLAGRWLAYVVLGGVAGGAAQLWQRLAQGHASVDARAVSGFLCLVFAAILLWEERRRGCRCATQGLGRRVGALGAFSLGLSVSILPCGPLLVLLSEIVLISHSAIQGAAYTAAFGAGAVTASLMLLVLLRGLAAGAVLRTGASAGSLRRIRLAGIGILFLYGLVAFAAWVATADSAR